jgi:hypothetical protein
MVRNGYRLRLPKSAAANGDAVTLGQLNQATSNTAINDSGGDTTFSALATSNGTALEGDAVDGTGVSGSSETGIGVAGVSGSTSAGAAAVYGEITSTSPGPFSAAVRGKNDGTFSRSGVATVAAGRSEVSHHLPLTSASFVLATIQGNVKDLYVRGVTITAGAHGSFTIHLSKAVATKTKVAWLVVN